MVSFELPDAALSEVRHQCAPSINFLYSLSLVSAGFLSSATKSPLNHTTRAGTGAKPWPALRLGEGTTEGAQWLGWLTQQVRPQLTERTGGQMMAHFTTKLILNYCPSFISLRENQPRAHSWVVEFVSFSVQRALGFRKRCDPHLSLNLYLVLCHLGTTRQLPMHIN